MNDMSEQELADMRERLRNTRRINQMASAFGLAPQMRRASDVAEFSRHLPEMIAAAKEADKTAEDCMAGKIAATVMRQLGFREPLKHPKWQIVADEVQEVINDYLETMTRVAKMNAEAK